MPAGLPCGLDPQLGRFAQADTIIPLQTQGTQAWDRYAGMNNNPVRYNDPSGHQTEADGSEPQCDPGSSSPCLSENYGLCLGEWGCSGTTFSSQSESIEWNLTEAPPYDWDNFDDDLASTISEIGSLIQSPLGDMAFDASDTPLAVGLGIDGAVQMADDFDNLELNDAERISRPILAAGEGAITGYLSVASANAAGMSAAAGIASSIGDVRLAVIGGALVWGATYLGVNTAFSHAITWGNSQLNQVFGGSFLP